MASGRWLTAAACAALVVAAWPFATARAQDYPNRTITILVPFPPGGGVDAVARSVVDALSAGLGQPIVIENKAGAAGSLAMGGFARAQPDGYTLAVTNNPPLTQNMFLQKSMPYESATAFQPISMIADTVIFLVVNAKVPVGSVAELVAYAKAAPKPLNYGSAGPGSTYHIAGELLKHGAGIEIAHVPYRGTAPLTQDLVGGAIEVAFGTPTGVMPFAESKALRILASIEARRHPEYPDIPTVSETVPGVVAATWAGILAPARTPRPIVDRLNAAVRTVLKDPGVVAKLKQQGWFAKGSTPEEFGRLLDDERERWGKVLPAVGLRPQ